MHKIFVLNYLYLCLYMFEAHVLIIRRSKLHYTASGIITPIGGRHVHRLRGDSYIGMNLTYCKTKFCASSGLIIEIKILRCTVSKMSKNLSSRFKCSFIPKNHNTWDIQHLTPHKQNPHTEIKQLDFNC